MINFKPMVRGYSASYRLAFVDSSDGSTVDITGWQIRTGIGSSRQSLGDIYEIVHEAPTDPDALANGLFDIAFTAEQTAGIIPNNIISDISVKRYEDDQYTPILLGRARVMTEEEYRVQYMQEDMETAFDQEYDGLTGFVRVDLHLTSIVVKVDMINPDELGLMAAYVEQARQYAEQACACACNCADPVDPDPVDPVAFSFSASASLADTSVMFADAADQQISWSISGVVGTASSGQVVLYDANDQVVETVAITTETSGTFTTAVDPTVSGYYVVATIDGVGDGAVDSNQHEETSTVAAASLYYPTFSGTSSDASNPDLFNTGSHTNSDFALGDGTVTTGVKTDFAWISIPASVYPGVPVFKFDVDGFAVPATITPSVTYSETFAGEPYNTYGFTDALLVTTVYTAAS